MAQVTVQEAKTHLSRLLERAKNGEDIVIAKGKTPVARLVPVADSLPTGRMYGAAKGLFACPPDAFFFDPLPEAEQRGWDGEDDAGPQPRAESCSTHTPSRGGC